MSAEPDTPLHQIRADLLRRLRLYEQGTLTTQRVSEGGAPVDTTLETIEVIKTSIAELDRVIGGAPRGVDHGT